METSQCKTCEFWKESTQKCKKVEYRGVWEKEELDPGIVTCIWDNRCDLAFGPEFGCIHYVGRLEENEESVESSDSENPIALARKVSREAFAAYPEWKDMYIANIKMYIFNTSGIEFNDTCISDESAICEGLLDLIFRE